MPECLKPHQFLNNNSFANTIISWYELFSNDTCSQDSCSDFWQSPEGLHRQRCNQSGVIPWAAQDQWTRLWEWCANTVLSDTAWCTPHVHSDITFIHANMTAESSLWLYQSIIATSDTSNLIRSFASFAHRCKGLAAMPKRILKHTLESELKRDCDQTRQSIVMKYRLVRIKNKLNHQSQVWKWTLHYDTADD